MSLTKHVINTPETLVIESLQGLCYTNPNLRLLAKEKILYDSNIDQIAAKQVTIISGGGSGHEPGYAGFIGPHMLSAAVCGNVFASPSSSQILAAIERVQSPHGTLVVIMNYTGDCLNFGLAIERAKANGHQVEMLVVADDVSIGQNGKVGRRGLAGTALVIKLAGALAAQGKSLQEICDRVQYAIDNVVTLGVALDHCHVPGSTSKLDPLQQNEMELGMGIHNESGFIKLNIKPAKQLVDDMMHMLMDQNDPLRSFLKLPSDKISPVVMLINNLGGTSLLELNSMVKEAVDYVVKQSHVELKRVYVGSFVTSLNMPGFSITLLKVKDQEVLDLLDVQVSVPGWPSSSTSFSATDIYGETRGNKQTTTSDDNDKTSDPKLLEKVIRSATQAVIDAEPLITEYDTILGDGDCGETLKTAALAIQGSLRDYPLHNSSRTVLAIADTIEQSVGGTSSAIYCIFLNALSRGLLKKGNWISASRDALTTLLRYTQARVGDRTLMDTLVPFINNLRHGPIEALKAAQKGCKSTTQLPAKLGRSSYLSESQVLNADIPDPGAYGLAQLLIGLVNSL